METITVKPPIKIGDKVWLSLNSGFGTCSFLERYKQYQECTIDAVKIEVTIKENLEIDYKFLYQVKEQKEKYWYYYTEETPRTKEQLYESFRDEIEKLIPEELRKYLW